MPIATAVLKRLTIIGASMFFVVTLSFALLALIPGDPASTILGGFASRESVEALRHSLDLDAPVGVRYLHYVTRLAHGDLGTSFYSSQPVTHEILRYLPNTIELVTLALLVAVAIGLTLGISGAYFRGRWPRAAASTAITATQSVPDFVLGLVLIYVLFFLWHVAPAPVGRLGIEATNPPAVTNFLFIDTILAGRWHTLGSALAHALLPALALGIAYSAYFSKTSRTLLTKAFASPQVEFARACGLPEWQVIRYAFLAVRSPIVTYGAILFGSLIGGASIIETIFAWQGLGQWGLEAMLRLDVPVIQGFVLVAGMATLLVYALFDLLATLLDPRIARG